MLFSARRLVMFYICAKFREIISNGIKVIERTLFLYGKLQRGIFTENVGGVTVVNLCTLSGHEFYFYQVLRNYRDGIKIIEPTRFLYQKLQWEKIRKTVGGVTVVNLCTTSSHVLYLCQVP